MAEFSEKSQEHGNNSLQLTILSTRLYTGEVVGVLIPRLGIAILTV